MAVMTVKPQGRGQALPALMAEPGQGLNHSTTDIWGQTIVCYGLPCVSWGVKQHLWSPLTPPPLPCDDNQTCLQILPNATRRQSHIHLKTTGLGGGVRGLAPAGPMGRGGQTLQSGPLALSLETLCLCWRPPCDKAADRGWGRSQRGKDKRENKSERDPASVAPWLNVDI